MLRDRRGFTVVELLVAMGLAGLVSGLAYASFLFSSRMVKNWRERVALENTAYLTITAVARDLLETKELLFAGEAKIGLVNLLDDTVIYLAEGNLIFRKGRPLSKNQNHLDEFRFEYYGSDSALDVNLDGRVDSYELDRNGNSLLERDELLSISLIEVTLTLTRLNHRFGVRTAVGCRNRRVP